MAFSIIARKFTVPEFQEYVKSVGKQAWVKRIVLHNTAAPSIAQRPGGILTLTHIKNLHTYYSQTQGWSGGPHLFIDAEGIWVFNPLDKKGVHSPSYNGSSWGVEMLGNFETESFTTGLGAKIAANAQAACAILAELQGWPDLHDQRLILHKEDKKTNHDCPGKNVIKSFFVSAANAMMGAIKPTEKSLVLEVDGKSITGAFLQDGVTYAPVRSLAEALGFKVIFDAGNNKVTITK